MIDKQNIGLYQAFLICHATLVSERILAKQDIVSRQGLHLSLEEMGLQIGDTVIAHVSLSKLGYIIGGERAVIGAIIDTIGKKGTLVMPSFSETLSFPLRWTSPRLPEESWADVMRNSEPWDRVLTPIDSSIGAVARCLKQFPKCRRSNHPLFSFVALGNQSKFVIAPHRLGDQLGQNSPLSRLYDLDAKVLLLGCGWQSCSILHLAEHRATWPGKQFYLERVPMLQKKHFWSKRSKRITAFQSLDLNCEDFEECGSAFLKTVNNEGKQKHLVQSSRTLVDFASDWFGANR